LEVRLKILRFYAVAARVIGLVRERGGKQTDVPESARCRE